MPGVMLGGGKMTMNVVVIFPVLMGLRVFKVTLVCTCKWCLKQTNKQKTKDIFLFKMHIQYFNQANIRVFCFVLFFLHLLAIKVHFILYTYPCVESIGYIAKLSLFSFSCLHIDWRKKVRYSSVVLTHSSLPFTNLS